MENRNHILDELINEYPALANMESVMPYSVPPGYFAGFPEFMLELVKPEHSSVLPTNKIIHYFVPSGYLDTLPDRMLNEAKAMDGASIDEELQVLSPLLGKLNKSTPYSLPAGYFDELPSNIADGAKAIALVNEELENLSAMMMDLKSKQPFKVPVDYFTMFPAKMLAKAKEQRQAKVVSMNFGKKLMRYAAAAVVAGLVLTAGWLYRSNSPASLEQVSDAELQEYVEAQRPIVDDENAAATFDIDAADVKEMLAEVTDEELQRYVEQESGVNINSTTN
ncbi:MAG: hypothetical protein H7Y31_04040 [Chitinophagaceae bacterium]|nr:hypothetical protein [Chitinophagaceae bacterium]